MEIHSIESFLDYYTRVRGRTTRVVELIPREHVEWTYRPGRFTLGDLVRHLAALECHMFAETACGRPNAYPGHGRELADGLDAVLEYFHSTHRETLSKLRELPDARLQEECVTPAGAKLRVWKWLRAMVEHEVHHRGQIYLYLAMLGVATPPLYGLTSEEVRHRGSVAGGT